MTLSQQALSRLADVVELQPTKNSELADRWGLDDGKAVHRYLESELSEYYYRDENSLIRATPEAAGLVDVEPGIENDESSGSTVVRVNELQRRAYEVLPESESDAMSVVAVLHAIRDAGGTDDPSVGDVRSALSALRRMGIVGVEYRSVPTYYRTDSATVEVRQQE